jgi:helix-turn-helix protein
VCRLQNRGLGVRVPPPLLLSEAKTGRFRGIIPASGLRLGLLPSAEIRSFGVVTGPRVDRSHAGAVVRFREQIRANVRESRLLTARQTAAVFGVHVKTLRRPASHGELRSVRITNRGWLRFRVDDVERLAGRRGNW